MHVWRWAFRSLCQVSNAFSFLWTMTIIGYRQLSELQLALQRGVDTLRQVGTFQSGTCRKEDAMAHGLCTWMPKIPLGSMFLPGTSFWKIPPLSSSAHQGSGSGGEWDPKWLGAITGVGYGRSEEDSRLIRCSFILYFFIFLNML